MSKLSGKPVTPLYLRSSMVYLSFLLNYSLSLSLSRCLPTAHIQTPACASLSLSSTHKSSNFDSCLYLPLNFFHNALSLSLSHFSYKLNFLYCNLYLYILHFNNFSIVFLSLSLSLFLLQKSLSHFHFLSQFFFSSLAQNTLK